MACICKTDKKTTSTCRCCYLCYNLSLDPACKKTLLRSAALLARCCQFVKQSNGQNGQSGLWYLHENQSNKHSNAYMINTFMQLYVLLNWRLEACMIIHVQLPHEDQTVAWQYIISTWKSNKVKLDLQARRHQGKVVGVLNRVTRVSSCYPLPGHTTLLLSSHRSHFSRLHWPPILSTLNCDFMPYTRKIFSIHICIGNTLPKISLNTLFPWELICIYTNAKHQL